MTLEERLILFLKREIETAQGGELTGYNDDNFSSILRQYLALQHGESGAAMKVLIGKFTEQFRQLQDQHIPLGKDIETFIKAKENEKWDIIRGLIPQPKGVERREALRILGGIVGTGALSVAACHKLAEEDLPANSPTQPGSENTAVDIPADSRSERYNRIQEVMEDPYALEQYGFSRELCQELYDYLNGGESQGNKLARTIVEEKLAILASSSVQLDPNDPAKKPVFLAKAEVINNTLEGKIAELYMDEEGEAWSKDFDLYTANTPNLADDAVKAIIISDDDMDEALKYALAFATTDLVANIDGENGLVELGTDDRSRIMTDGYLYDDRNRNNYIRGGNQEIDDRGL